MVWGLNPSFPNVLGPEKQVYLLPELAFWGLKSFDLPCHVGHFISFLLQEPPVPPPEEAVREGHGPYEKCWRELAGW